MLTTILVFICYHCDDDRVRLSVKDFELYRAFSMRLVVGKKKQFYFSTHNRLNPFFIILISIVWLPNVQFTRIVRFLRRCNDKNTRHRVKPLLKKGKRPKKRRGGVFGKSQFCREKKNRKIKEEKKKQRKKVRLVKFDFRVDGACQILVSISTKLHFKKTNAFIVFI